MQTNPTPFERQRIAFSYLRGHAINAHIAGDGLLVNLLSHSGFDQVSKLEKNKKLLLSASELAWMPILGLYWMMNSYEQNTVFNSFYKISSKTEDDNHIKEWLKCYDCLIAQPLSLDDDLITKLRSINWPECFIAYSPEVETLLSHILELVWFRDPASGKWKEIKQAWLQTASPWVNDCLDKISSRLEVQTRLTAPNKLVPVFQESAIEELRKHSTFAELWLLHLNGRAKELCVAIERLTPKVSADSHYWRVLGDFNYINSGPSNQNESAAVHLARRRRLSVDTPLLIFHDKREERINAMLGELFRTQSEGMASQRWGVFTLAMLHELSALRLWDYGMWRDAISAQSQAILESTQWTNDHPALSANGLINSIRSLTTRDPLKDILTRNAIDTLEFTTVEVLEDLAGQLIATYPKQKYNAAQLLEDLTDLLPSTVWEELAKWTISYSKESAARQTSGWKLGPATHWINVLMLLQPDSRVWSILQPEALAMSRMSTCWHGSETAGFIRRWLVFAPVVLAREVADSLFSHPEIDTTACLKRTILLIDFEKWRPEFKGLFTKRLIDNPKSLSEGLVLARHLNVSDLVIRERNLRERMTASIRTTIKLATPSIETTQFTANFAGGVEIVENWMEDDIQVLKELIAAVNSKNVLQLYLPWLLRTIQLMVANGPPEFARIAQPHVSNWIGKLPQGRAIGSPTRGPFSAIQWGSDSENIALSLGWLAFQLPRKIGAEANTDVITWIKVILLSGQTRPLEMAIYGSVIVALTSNPSRTAESLSLFETALVSLWTKSKNNQQADQTLASALDLLTSLIGSSSDSLINWNDKHAKRCFVQFLEIIEQYIPQFSRSPRADLRASVAAFLWHLNEREKLQKELISSFHNLKKDNRARVRFEAQGGWLNEGILRALPKFI